MARPTQLRKPRFQYAEDLAVGTYPGTENLLDRLTRESTGVTSWRPVRAAVMMAISDERPRVWMTTEEFRQWETEGNAVRRRLKLDIGPCAAIGMSKYVALKIRAGTRAVLKHEAMACAHFKLGFPMPIEAGNAKVFGEWFASNFGALGPVASFLEFDGPYLGDRVRGFRIRQSERVTTLPEIDLIRALDWLLRCGPCIPYGDREALPAFPGQGE